MSESTCGRCEHLCVTDGEFKIVGCAATGYVVPAFTQYPDNKVTLWRIPLECPRSDDVIKSENKAPESQWVTVPLDSLPIQHKEQ